MYLNNYNIVVNMNIICTFYMYQHSVRKKIILTVKLDKRYYNKDYFKYYFEKGYFICRGCSKNANN